MWHLWFSNVCSQQERLESLKQSIEFMSGLDNSTTQPTKSEDQGGSGVDQKHERSSITDSSESSQTPSTPRSFNALRRLTRAVETIVTERRDLARLDPAGVGAASLRVGACLLL